MGGDNDFGFAAAKAGFVFEPKSGKGGKLHKRLGQGTYKAYQFGQRVTVVASGLRPNFQTIVTLEVLPMSIFPPQYGLFFTDPDNVSPAIFPFHVEAHFHSEEGIRSMVVYDADGRHDVPVEPF